MRLSGRQFTKQWTINDFPLFYVDLLFYGDTHKRKKLLGHSYGQHVLASVKRMVTFFQNKKTVQRTAPIGKRRYLDQQYIRSFIALTKRIEQRLDTVMGEINQLNSAARQETVARVFDRFVHRYAELLAVYRFTRPDMYEAAIESLQQQVPGMESHHLPAVLEGNRRDLDMHISQEYATHFQLLKKIGDRRLHLHHVYASRYEEAKKLLHHIGDRMDVPPTLVEQATRAELYAFLHNGRRPNSERLAKRNHEYVYRYGTNRGYIIYDRVAYQEPGQQKQCLTTLYGTPGFPGQARGPVRVIAHNIGRTQHHEMKAMRRGEILVTVSTSPDMMPAIRKAAAIVVEEGGILSHAAIVSRELEIPCLMGVQEATQHLRTGDVVHVDTQKMIVEKM